MLVPGLCMRTGEREKEREGGERGRSETRGREREGKEIDFSRNWN